jgi:hypothetical protein
MCREYGNLFENYCQIVLSLDASMTTRTDSRLSRCIVAGKYTVYVDPLPK